MALSLARITTFSEKNISQAYNACVSFIDAQLGLLMDSLKKQGLWDDTIIVFTSDYGFHLGDHFIWDKVTLFDIGEKFPFLYRPPAYPNPTPTPQPGETG